MGIGINIASICIHENLRRPLGRTLLFGRQTMLFSPRMALDAIRDCGGQPPAVDVKEIGLDRETLAHGQESIRDAEFFRLLGVTDIHSMDKSDYEGADIIHDLNAPIPEPLAGMFDFILDGSTIDNVFDPAMAIRNMARLLAPGGRAVSVNMASNHNDPYTILSPTWILDYFVVNAFADCRVWLTLIRDDGGFCTYSLDLDRLDRDHPAPNFRSSYQMGLVFVAEKHAVSTWERMPSQQQYRSQKEWDDYERKLAVMRRSAPRTYCGSGIKRPFMDAPPGYKFER